MIKSYTEILVIKVAINLMDTLNFIGPTDFLSRIVAIRVRGRVKSPQFTV
jgi:hypothetical protein